MGVAGTVADVLDALVSTLTTGLSSYGERLVVRDGPPLLDRTPEIEVWIGATGADADDVGAQHRATWATMGAGAASQRDVEIDVPCGVWTIGGETDMAVRRRTAADVLDAIDALLIPPDPLGLPEVLCGGVELTLGSPRQIQATDGASVAWAFTVHTTARI